jgi:general secretion pathway protein C
LAESLGVRNGDIIRGVEGQRLDGVERAIEIYKEVKDKPLISVEVERGGRPVTLTYEIKD